MGGTWPDCAVCLGLELSAVLSQHVLWVLFVSALSLLIPE